MTPRRKRMSLVFGIIAGVSVAGALALNAFRQNVTFFFDPTAVTAGQVPAGERDGEELRVATRENLSGRGE